MLELVQIEDNSQDNVFPEYNRTFTLTFQDKQLSKPVWQLLEKELKKYKTKLEDINIESEGFNLKDKYYLSLFVEYPKNDEELTNEDIDDSLEEIKTNFTIYYESILDRILMVPLLVGTEE